MSRFKRFLIDFAGIIHGIYFGNYFRAMTDEELFDRASIVHRLGHAHVQFSLQAERLNRIIIENPWIFGRKETP